MKRIGWVSCLAVLGIALSSAVQAQTTATISGTVKDESGSVLPGVTVTVTEVNTSATRTVVTEHDGRFRAPQLSIGNYEVRAEMQGFQTAIQRGIQLTVGREAVLELALKVGGVEESVIVSAEAPLVNATSANVGALVERTSIEMMPLNGRDITQLATLQPTVTLLVTKSTSPTAGQGTNISIAGSRPNQSGFLMDGTDLTGNSGKGVGGVSGAFLGIDTVQEFTVQMSNYSAEYGRAGGGVVNVVTRSGSNSRHGGLFYYHRNSVLDAKNHFDPEKPDFKRHQFGATLGGPIRQNRMFYFASYEGFRQDLGIGSTSFVPTSAMKEGQLPGGRTIAVSAAIRPLLPLWPLPNGRVFSDGTGEYITSDMETTRDDHASLRLDHRISEATSLFLRYTITDGVKHQPFFGSTFGGYPLDMKSRSQYLTAQATRVVGSRIVMVGRLGGNMSHYSGHSTADNPELRFYDNPARTIGNIVVGQGIAGLGNGINQPFDHPVSIIDLSGDITRSGSVHQVKVGASFKKYLWGFQRDFRVNGTLTYLNWADFLQNLGDRFEGISPTSDDSRRHYRQDTIGMFAQDDIRVSEALTINAGLRYEFITNPTEATGPRIAMIPNGWDVTDDPLGVKVDTVFEKNPSLRNFSPRIGFAWALGKGGKSSLRGGWGLFYDTIYPLLYDNMRVPPYFMTLDLRAATLRRPITYPNAVALGSTLAALSPVAVDYYNDKTTTIQQWNLTYQREIMPQTVVQLGYMGSSTKFLPVANDPNTRIPQFLPDGTIFFPAANVRRNPNWGRLSILEWKGKAWYNAIPIALTKRYGNGFQLGANYTWSRNIDQGSGTVGGDAAQDNRARVNPYDIKSNQGLAAQHVAHAFSANSVYELPLGPGKRFGADMTGLGAALAGGWGVQGILTLRSGPPFSVIMGGDRARSFTEAQRPNLKSGYSNNPILGEIDAWYDVNAFEMPAAGYFGNLGRNTLIGPGLATLDLSFVKNQKIGAKTLQVRVEFFNLTNRVNLALPAREVISSTGTIPASAGRITATDTPARQMQIAARLTF